MARRIAIFIIFQLFVIGKLCAQAPLVSSFSPAAGAVGSTVVVSGNNFNTTPGNNIVYFGTGKGSVTQASANQLTVTVPAGLSYAPLTVLNTATGLTGYSTNPFIPTFPSKNSIASGDFILKSTISDANAPTSFDVGDIDGDGKPDIVVTYLNDSLAVYRNISTTGNAAFAPPVYLATGGQPANVKIADVDGDGKPDIILVNTYNNAIWVYNNASVAGTITFSSETTINVPNTIGLLTVADINGDGKPEIIVTSTSSTANEMAIFQNTSTPGHISFDAEALLEPTGYPNCLSITDVDGDGKPDVVVGNGSDILSVFRNVSSGGTIVTASFAARQDITLPFTFSTLTAGDLNGDGKPDLVLFGKYTTASVQGGNTVFTLLNQSTAGNISFSSQSTNSVGGGPQVSLGDIDGDGKPDIVVHGGGTVTILRNVSTADKLVFSPNTDIPIDQYGGPLLIADMDGDGKPDLAVRNEGTKIITAWLNEPLPAQPVLPPAPVITALSPAAGPYNTAIQITGQNFNPAASSGEVVFGATDGQIVSASATSLTVKVPPGSTYAQVSALNLSNGLAGASGQSFIPTLKVPQKLSTASYGTKNFLTTQQSLVTVVADVNGDGIPDLVSLVVSGSTRGFSVSAGINSTQSFSYASGKGFGNSSSNFSGLLVADIDGDGKPDVVLFGAGPGVMVFLNTSTTTAVNFAAGVNVSAATGYVAIADVDGDGKPDIAVSSSDGVTILLNASTTGTVSFPAQTYIETGNNPLAVQLRDIDGDGKADLITSSGGGNYSYAFIFLNRSVAGGVAFSSVSALNIGAGPRIVAGIADMDGDGKPDIVSTTDLTDYGESLTIIRNTSSPGNPSFAPVQSFLITAATGIITKNIAIADLDGDGRPDVVADIVGSSTPLLSQEVILLNASAIGAVNMTASLALTTDPSPLNVSVADLDGDGKPEILFDRVTDVNGNLGGLEFFTNSNLEVFTSLYTTYDDPTKGKSQVIDTAVTVKALSAFTLKQATVSIAQNFTPAEDSLIFVSVPSKTGDIAGSYNSTSGVLTLTSATATITQLQSALQSVSYYNSNALRPDTNERVVNFVFTNGTDTSNTALKYIRVGPGSLTGFPIPVITPNGPTAFLQGGSVLLSVSPPTGYAYQWALNGVDISGATTPTYTAKISGNYTVSITLNSKTATSDATTVVAAFLLPPDNFKLAVTSATCDGSSDGSVNITAQQTENYTATITGNSLNATYPFTASTNINNLPAGTYSVCMTVAGQSAYQQCFEVVINQPAALSAYSTVNAGNKTVSLVLTGGDVYNISLNGTIYNTTDSTITLPLTDGSNDLIVSTDKLCQGSVEKLIDISGEISPYPVPFQNTLNINLGLNNINNVSVEIHSLTGGSLVFSKHYVNQSGVLQLDLTNLSIGVYSLHLSMGQSEKVFKITKQ